MKKVLLFGLSLFLILSIPVKADTKPIAKNIFIGDSRTVMMYFAMHTYDTKSRVEIDEYVDGEYWKAKGASEFKYMSEEAIPTIEPYIGKDTNVYILFGVNNDNNIDKVNDYAELLNDKSEQWSNLGANVYYVSVNPVVDGKAWYTGTMGYCTEWIEEWNKQVQEKFDWTNMTYIDTYNDIGDQLEDIDGVHYKHSSSRLIYEYITTYEPEENNNLVIGDRELTVYGKRSFNRRWIWW